MKNKTTIPILIKVNGEEKIMYKDVSSLSTESLLKLKRCFRGILFDTSLAINEIIDSDVLSDTQIRHSSGIKPYKEEKKQEKKIKLLKRRKRR